jgi:hypothetical protein
MAEQQEKIATGLGSIALEGESGQEYAFAVYPFDMEFNTLTGGVYAVTRRYDRGNDEWCHRIIFIGETPHLPAYFSDHPSADRFRRAEANCICIHTDTREQSRHSKFKDLVAAQQSFREA